MGQKEQFRMPRSWCQLVEPPCPYAQAESCGVSRYFRYTPDWKKRRKLAIEFKSRLPGARDELVEMCTRTLFPEI